MRNKILFLTLFVALFSCEVSKENKEVNSSENHQITKDVDVLKFSSLLNTKKGNILDVRTPEEYKEGHLQGAVNNNIYDPAFEANLIGLNKSEPIYVYCAKGGRSAKAMKKMKALGFREVYNLLGGYTAWNEAGQYTEQ